MLARKKEVKPRVRRSKMLARKREMPAVKMARAGMR